MRCLVIVVTSRIDDDSILHVDVNQAAPSLLRGTLPTADASLGEGGPPKGISLDQEELFATLDGDYPCV